jgi:regulatory protein
VGRSKDELTAHRAEANSKRTSQAALPLDETTIVLSLDDDEPAPADVMDAAGSLLEKRARIESDLADRLSRRGYNETTIASTMASLKRLGLVDDAAYAREWIATRMGSRAMGRAGLIALLEDKGIDREVAEAAVDASGQHDEAAAVEYARANLRRLSGLSPPRQAAKLQRMLANRGFEDEAVEAAIKSVTPPEGWD